MGSTGCSWKSNDVATPKLPPPPRKPQNRSLFCCALAVRNLPSAVTTSMARTLSQASPKRAAEAAEAAAEREPAHARVRNGAGRGRETVRQRFAIERA